MAGPALVANTYLEGTYSEVYPDISQDEEGMKRLFTQFSFPGGIPSHVAPETPGSIHEGGELGYALSHAYGAAFDNPGSARRLRRSATAKPRPGRWPRAGTRTSSSIRRRDGAVLPILHLNGYKIANPTRAGAHQPRGARSAAAAATATRRTSSRATTRRRCTSRWPRRSTRSIDEIQRIQKAARARRRRRSGRGGR